MKRDFVADLRRLRSFACLFLFVGACIAVIIAMWPEDLSALQAVRETSKVFFFILTMLMGIGAVVLLPGVAAMNLAAEKEQDTYDQLCMTLISPRGIVFAKYVSVAGLYLLLVVAALPVLGVTLFTIGVDWAEIGRNAVILLFIACSCTAVGLLSGALFRKTLAAAVMAYVSAGLFAVGAYALTIFLSYSNLRFLGGNLGILQTRLGLYNLLIYLAGVTVVCLALTGRALQRKQEPPRVLAGEVIDDPAPLENRRKHFPYSLIDPLRRKPPIEDGRNPVLVKELRYGAVSAFATAFRRFYIALFLFVLFDIMFVWPQMVSYNYYYYRIGFYWGGDFLNGIVIQCILAFLFVPPLVVSAFTKEHESESMDALRMTLLEPRHIVMGKLPSALMAVIPVFLAANAALLPGLVIGMDQGYASSVYLAGMATLLVCIWAALCITLLASSMNRRTSSALVTAYLLNALVLVGIPLLPLAVYGLTGILTQQTFRPYNLVYYTRLEKVAEFLIPFSEYIKDFGNSRNLRSGLNVVLWINSEVYFVLLGWAFVGLTILHFKKRRMRDR